MNLFLLLIQRPESNVLCPESLKGVVPMKLRFIAVAVTTALVSVSILFADESPLFLSLTRRAQSLDQMPANVSVITAKEIERENARTVGEALEGMIGITEGVYGTYGSVNNLSIRGSTSEQVLVLIDGRRINDPASGLADAGTIPVDNIDRIEIIRGGASAVYGSSAFGGAINIITKRNVAEIPAIDVGASYGDFNTRKLSLGVSISSGPLSGMITAGKLASDGWRKNSEYDSRNVFVRLGYDIGTYGTLDLSGSVFNSEAGVPGPGATLDQYDGTIERTASSPDANQDQNTQYIRLEHQKQWDDDILKTALYTSRNRIDYNDPKVYSDPGGFSFGPSDTRSHSLTWGGEIQLATGEGTVIGTEWWRDSVVNSDFILGADTVDRSRDSVAAYFLHELQTGRFSATPGIRIDTISSFGTIASPKITVLYRLDERWKFSVNMGRSWRAPTMNELYWSDPSMHGNPHLSPEEGITSDIGAEFSGQASQGKCMLFLTRADNLITWRPNPLTFIYEAVNISRSQQAGIELELSQRIIQGLYHKANYTYLWAKDTENNTVLPYRPMHTLKYEAAYLFPWNTKLSANVRYYSKQETGTLSNLPAYTLTGLRIAQKVSEMEIWASVDNIADIKYQTRLGFPLPGRTLAAGLSARL